MGDEHAPASAGSGKVSGLSDSPSAFERPKWDLVDAAAVICFDAGVFGLAAWLIRLLGPGAGAYVSAVMRPALVLPVVFVIARRWWGASPSDLGVARPRPGAWRWFAGFSLLVALGYLAAGCALVLVLRGRVDGLWFSRLRGSVYSTVRPTVLVSNALSMLVIAPLVEEPIFRGILCPALRARLGRGWAVLASAVIFAGMHPLWRWTAFLPVTQFLGGLIFAWSYERTRSLVFPVIFHAIGNAAILSWTLILTYRPGWVEPILGLSTLGP